MYGAEHAGDGEAPLPEYAGEDRRGTVHRRGGPGAHRQKHPDHPVYGRNGIALCSPGPPERKADG